MSRLDFRGVGKTFPGVVALDGVDLSVGAGEVRALMGENGAGKSTLLKILSGDYQPDAGALAIDGVVRRFTGPRDSAAAGIAIIHQELQLAPNLSVAENLLLGALPSRQGFVDRSALRERASAVLARLGEAFDPDTAVGRLSIGKRQMVEIGKALLRDARIIAFDEPTSSLSAREVDSLMRIIADLREEGRTIVYISHRLEEVARIADSVTVLRDGRVVADWAVGSKPAPDALISAMAGRTIADVYGYRPREIGDVVLEATGLAGPGLTRPCDLRVRRGEMVGLFGLVGAGRSELFKLLFGACRATAGSVRIAGDRIAPGRPRDAIAHGLGFCPEDRKDEGIVPLASVRENVAMARRNLSPGRLTVDAAAERTACAGLVATMRIKTNSTETAIGTLSGGNQQKAIIARWLAADADILLLDEPTRGIDVAARSEIYDHIFRLAETGRTILFVSSDMAETIGIADRIVVMREGAVAGIVPRGEANPDRLLELALPQAAPAAAA